MFHGKKNDSAPTMLFRIKDIADLKPGQNYHIRKLLDQQGSVVYDEVHDIVLKEVKDNLLIEDGTEDSYSFAEFRVYIRKKI